MNMNKWVERVENPRLEELKSENRSSISIGDTVKVGVQIREGDRTRVQNYQGTIIRQHKNGLKSTFTVRRVFQGIGIERIFPLYSPAVVKIEILAHGKVRRSKLNFLRNKKGKAARLKAKS